MDFLWNLMILSQVAAIVAQLPNFNFSPTFPDHVTAHMFLYGNGSVPIAEGPNPFANNALNGTEFMTVHQNWDDETVAQHRQDAIDFWNERFGLDGQQLMDNGAGIVVQYQISPAVNERAYLMNTPCHTPPEGHEVIDGGFQLFVTHPEGLTVTHPVTGEDVHYPFQTNLVYAWLRIHARDAEDDCGVVEPPPEWIVLRYQSLGLAKWALNAIVFELELVGENYFGFGKSLGVSAPILTQTDIINRLLNYITFETSGPEVFFDHTPLNSLNLTAVTAQEEMTTDSGKIKVEVEEKVVEGNLKKQLYIAKGKEGKKAD